MEQQSEPFVSVITPVYNQGKYLADCIESVLAQTYTHWEYVIVNNCSSDQTLEVAQHYAQQDPRIRIHTNSTFLDLMPNWNHALRQISDASQYCKVVHADDFLFPDCLTQMVRLAEGHPNVGLIGSYGLTGTRVEMDGLPYPSTVVAGKEICRAFMFHIAKLGGLWLFGSPTSTLIRSDLIRKRASFYNEENIHADTEVCCEVLQETDFGFVHQVLTYTREHIERQSTSSADLYKNILCELTIFLKYGPICLDEHEYAMCEKRAFKVYYQTLAKCVLMRKRREFWAYHTDQLKRVGHPLSLIKLGLSLVAELSSLVLNPVSTYQKLRRRVHNDFHYEIQREVVGSTLGR